MSDARPWSHLSVTVIFTRRKLRQQTLQHRRETRDILGGLNVLKDDIAGDIDRTYELVQKGLADFKASQGSSAG